MSRWQLRKVLGDAWQRDPIHYARDARNYDIEPSTVEQVVSPSSGLGVLRQGLSALGLPGGYSKERMDEYRARRRMNKDVAEHTVEVGNFDGIEDLPKVGKAGQIARSAAQVAGQLGRDATTQGALTIWWLVNAPEAVAMLGSQAATHGALRSRPARKLGGVQITPPREAVSPAAEEVGALRTRGLSMPGTATMAVFPSIIGAGLATGTLMRDQGYQAVLPTREDFKESESPLYEGFLRMTGRKGRLLPYTQFVEERPDVSNEQYEAYQRYRNTGGGALKGTMEGIHGPEISFMGRSIPLLTGIIPLAAAAVGARRGHRMGGNRAAGRGIMGRQKPGTRRSDAFMDLENARKAAQQAQVKSGYDSDQAAAARAEVIKADKVVNYNLVGGTAAGAAAGLVLGGAAGALAENMRRAANYRANQQKELQEQAASAAEPAAIATSKVEQAAMQALEAEMFERQRGR